MKFEELVDFIENRRSMSHIYQPLLIRTLVDSGGSATLRRVAHAFLRQDESQLLYYENTIKRMPLRILKKHGIGSQQGGLVALNTGALDFVQRAKVMVLCEQKLQEFVQKRGLAIWDYRLLDEPVPDSLRYQVLKASGGKCVNTANRWPRAMAFHGMQRMGGYHGRFRRSRRPAVPVESQGCAQLHPQASREIEGRSPRLVGRTH